MRRVDVEIPAPDGHSNGTLHLPDGDGPWPGVLLFPDAGGSRETIREMEGALTAAGVDHILEIYPARHGFAVSDNPTYDAEANARHWDALRRCYQTHLGDGGA
jgi:dienelactone hydrolase